VEIGNLRNLISLNVQSNPLPHLPKSIGRLQSLRSFNASSCELEQIPDELGTIMTLERISLTHNRLGLCQIPSGNCPSSRPCA